MFKIRQREKFNLLKSRTNFSTFLEMFEFSIKKKKKEVFYTFSSATWCKIIFEKNALKWDQSPTISFYKVISYYRQLKIMIKHCRRYEWTLKLFDYPPLLNHHTTIKIQNFPNLRSSTSLTHSICRGSSIITIFLPHRSGPYLLSLSSFSFSYSK